MDEKIEEVDCGFFVGLGFWIVGFVGLGVMDIGILVVGGFEGFRFLNL